MIAFLKICGLLLAVIIASAKKVPISITLVVASVAAGFLFMPLEKIPTTFLKIIISWDTWKYVLALWAVLLLEGSLNKMGMLKSLASSSVKIFTDRRYACAVLPSVIGFMPSVGGAYFSAPLVHEVAKDMDISKEKKAFINYWFRHIWESSIPLYPGILMAAAITGFSVPKVMAFQFPVTILGAFTGFAVAYKGVGRTQGEKGQISKRVLEFLKDAWPILLAIIFVLTLPTETVVSILLSIAILWIVIIVKVEKGQVEGKFAGRVFVDAVKESFRPNYFIILLGSILLNQVLQNSTAFGELSVWFNSTGIPPVFVAIVLPMILGMLIGATPGFVGVSFPIVLAIAGNSSYGIFALAFTSGVIGVLFSPMHLCIVLTCDYFKTTLFKVFRLMLFPAIAQMALGILTWWVSVSLHL
ncbi:MAG: DUF401 family protein [Caldisericales bacterium]|nr:DUF401 family protein [bacterium]